MANQRPIRRFKKRFYGLSARPKRWAASSDYLEVELGGPPGLVATVIPSESVGGTVGVPPVQTLLDGEFDVADWADEQEVRVDRIVGSIGLQGRVSNTDSPAVDGPPAIIRLGIIVHEEKSSDLIANDPTRKLFNQADLQEAEWMWLKQVVVAPPHGDQRDGVEPGAPGYLAAYWVNMSIDVDIRNRRKIGQKDQLFLYASYATPQSYGLAEYTWAVRIIPMLRLVMVSK